MTTVRKNQARLSKGAWEAFVGAIDAIRQRGAKKPTYGDFLAGFSACSSAAPFVRRRAQSSLAADWSPR